MSTNYQPGAWYTCKNWGSKHDYIKLDYVNEDKAYFTECIINTKHNFRKTFWVFNELIPVSLFEIFEFLPENHPDKKIEFIPGKWYKNLGREKSYIAKFKKFEFNGFFTDEYISQNMYKTTSSGVLEYNDAELLEDISSIINILPVTHPDVKEYILEKAKKDYPIGTTFKCLHLKNRYVTITDHKNIEFCEDGALRVNDVGYGCLYDSSDKQWAKIKKEEKLDFLEVAKKRFPIGSEVSNHNLGLTCKFEVTGTNFLYWGNDILINSDSVKEGSNYTVYCGSKNQWAEVISFSIKKEHYYVPLEESIVKVFNKYNIGDIVVSLGTVGTLRQKGDLFKILEKSSEFYLYYTEKNCSAISSQWRKATKEEIEAYNNGVKNIENLIPIKKSTELNWSSLDLESWKQETKKLNLSLSDLIDHIRFDDSCNYLLVYKKLKGETSIQKAENLLKEFNQEENLLIELIQKEDLLIEFSQKEKLLIDNIQSIEIPLLIPKENQVQLLII